MSSQDQNPLAPLADQLIGLSVSYQRDNLLRRGLGLEHLRELLISLARPLLRRGASLAYGGFWKETKENFTFDLLRLVSTEQENAEQETGVENERSLDDRQASANPGLLYNHVPWPLYLDVTPQIEARWINVCRIVRIDQKLAGIDEADRVPDGEAKRHIDRAFFNAAIALSAMRRLSTEGTDKARPISARVLLGGKVKGFSGSVPGFFEEALVTLEHSRPLYVLGGFGGGAEVLAKAMLGDGPTGPEQLTLDWLKAHNPAMVRMDELACTLGMPAGARTSADLLEDLVKRLKRGRTQLAATLNTGLDEPENRELLETMDISRAVHLVRKGLEARFAPNSSAR